MKTTYFPCVRGTMGDWTYYTTVMAVKDLVQYVRFAEELSPNKDLDSMLQRELTTRATEIAHYLSSNEQRFFGSLIIAALDGKPRFRPITFGESILEDQGRVGVLQFDGTEQYYALDGQHRLAAFPPSLRSAIPAFKRQMKAAGPVSSKRNRQGNWARASRTRMDVGRSGPCPNHLARDEDAEAERR